MRCGLTSVTPASRSHPVPPLSPQEGVRSGTAAPAAAIPVPAPSTGRLPNPAIRGSARPSSRLVQLRDWFQGRRNALTGGGVLLFSLSLFGMPMSGLHLSQMQALNRELGKLCSDPPRQALNVCRLHAQLVRSL